MKLMSLFFFFMAINIGLLLYTMGAQGEQYAANTDLYPDSQLTFDIANPDFADHNLPSTENSEGYAVGGYNAKDLWTAFLLPGDGNNSRIILYIVAFALLIGALGFIPFINRSDLSVLSGPFVVLIAVAGPTIVNFYSFVNREVGKYACADVINGCLLSQLMGAVIAGSLFIAWLFSCLEWWTGRPTGP